MAESCPDCPLCGNPPRFVMGVQAFCGTDHCQVLAWNLDRTPAENMAHANEVSDGG